MKAALIRFFLSLFAVFLLSESVHAQFDILKKVFEPDVLQVTDKLRDYIRGNEFPEASHDRNKELKHVDMIFQKGMEFSKNKVGAALLSISLAVLNRTFIKPTFPLIGTIRVPLPAEDSSDAASRIEKLPRYLFTDSPQYKWGDSAKLVHFFGSAYLTYETGTSKVPDQIGIWIEEGEASFKLDSVGQQRDVFINRLGQQFGNALSKGREVLPSDFLRTEMLKSEIGKIHF